jgi:hypothetical protein
MIRRRVQDRNEGNHFFSAKKSVENACFLTSSEKSEKIKKKMFEYFNRQVDNLNVTPIIGQQNVL